MNPDTMLRFAGRYRAVAVIPAIAIVALFGLVCSTSSDAACPSYQPTFEEDSRECSEYKRVRSRPGVVVILVDSSSALSGKVQEKIREKVKSEIDILPEGSEVFLYRVFYREGDYTTGGAEQWPAGREKRPFKREGAHPCEPLRWLREADEPKRRCGALEAFTRRVAGHFTEAGIFSTNTRQSWLTRAVQDSVSVFSDKECGKTSNCKFVLVSDLVENSHEMNFFRSIPGSCEEVLDEYDQTESLEHIAIHVTQLFPKARDTRFPLPSLKKLREFWGCYFEYQNAPSGKIKWSEIRLPSDNPDNYGNNTGQSGGRE